jgi:hypothetical protein
MLWHACGCGSRQAVQIHRSWWMRLLFPRRRLFACKACGRTMLLPPHRQLRRLPY